MIHRLSVTDITTEVLNRISSKIKYAPGNGCWIWEGRTRTIKGHLYPQTYVQGHNRNVKQVVDMYYNEQLKPRPVTNTCGNERCINPKHLERFKPKAGSLESIAHARKTRWTKRGDINASP